MPYSWATPHDWTAGELVTDDLMNNITNNINFLNEMLPIGVVLPYAGPTAPSNWLFCYGTAVSRTTYSQLWGVIGSTYGVGDGSTTFNIPDLRHIFPLGKKGSTNLGDTGGEETHVLTTGELPSHDHDMWSGTFKNATGANANHWYFAPQADQFSTTVNPKPKTGTTGSGTAHNNMPPYLVLNYIIRAKY